MSNEEWSVTISDPVLGKRTISSVKELIEDQLKMLKAFRDDGRSPSQELLNDIRVYEFILNSKDPEEYGNAYLIEKDRLRSFDKLEVARSLGWPL